MRALFTQFSGLIGVLTFLNHLMSETPLDKTIIMGLGAGLSVYLVLLLGDLAIHRILEHTAALQLTEKPAEAGTPASTKQESAPLKVNQKQGAMAA